MIRALAFMWLGIRAAKRWPIAAIGIWLLAGVAQSTFPDQYWIPTVIMVMAIGFGAMKMDEEDDPRNQNRRRAKARTKAWMSGAETATFICVYSAEHLDEIRQALLNGRDWRLTPEVSGYLGPVFRLDDPTHVYMLASDSKRWFALTDPSDVRDRVRSLRNGELRPATPLDIAQHGLDASVLDPDSIPIKAP